MSALSKNRTYLEIVITGPPRRVRDLLFVAGKRISFSVQRLVLSNALF